MIKKNNIPNFVTFFDENMFYAFKLLYFSVKKIYINFNFYIGIPKEFYLLNKSFFDNLKNVYISYLDYDKLDKMENGIGRISNAAFARLYVYDYFPKIKKKSFIYTDTDIMFNKSLDPNYFIDKKINLAFLDDPIKNEVRKFNSIEMWKRRLINDKIVCNKVIDLMNNSYYFNSGLLIINNHKKFKKLLNKVIKSDHKVSDQSLLNYYNDGEIIVVRSEYDNIFPDSLENHEDKENVTTIHFVGAKKPWNKEHDGNNNLKLAKSLVSYDSIASIIDD